MPVINESVNSPFSPLGSTSCGISRKNYSSSFPPREKRLPPAAQLCRLLQTRRWREIPSRQKFFSLRQLNVSRLRIRDKMPSLHLRPVSFFAITRAKFPAKRCRQTHECNAVCSLCDMQLAHAALLTKPCICDALFRDPHFLYSRYPDRRSLTSYHFSSSSFRFNNLRLHHACWMRS